MISNIDYNNESIDDIRRLFDYFKPKKTDEGFAGRRNNCIEYIAKEIILKIYHQKNILK